MAVVLLLMATAILVQVWLVYELVRQSGRILLRLEVIERRLSPNPSSPAGLPLGSIAPPFELPSLSGERVSLAQFRGRRVLLVFFNPRCGYCARMAPELAHLAANPDQGTIPLVVSSGDTELNHRFFREHQIGTPVLLQDQNEVAELYRVHATPGGYLLDEQGCVASEGVAGAEVLMRLARTRSVKKDASSGSHSNGAGHSERRGNLPLSASTLKRDGLSPGTPAPDFRLPRVDGLGELSLSDYHGRPVLLVFSDPDCGPCMALTPKLEALHRRSNLEVLMVSRGSTEENRRKIAEHGLTFPVVLQKHWEISREYAMFATPVGYLIDGKGLVASDAVVGEDAILATASRASQAQSNVRREPAESNR